MKKYSENTKKMQNILWSLYNKSVKIQKGKQAIIWRTEWQKDNNGQENTTEKTNVLETLEDPGAFEG